MWILFFFLISQTLTKEWIWDGNKRWQNVGREIVYIGSAEGIWQGSVGEISKRLTKGITFLNYMTLKNIKIFEANITNYKPGRIGVHLAGIGEKHEHNAHKQIFAVTYMDRNYFFNSHHTTCQISYCENGLFFISNINADDMYKAKVDDFEEIFYLKFVTSDMNFRLDRFTITENNFPLILCPYKTWVGIQSGTKFIPYETNGIIFSNFFERQILLPGYPRSEDSDIFVCGYIKYEDGSQLTISHEIEIKDYYKIDSIKSINDFQHIWKCSEGEATTDYHYFIYSYNFEGNHKMKHILKDSVDKNKFYYNDTMYLYKETYTKDLKNVKNRIGHGYVMNPIKPDCRWKLPQLKFKIRLVSLDGSKIFDSKDGIQIMDVRENMLNKDIYYKCKIVIEEATRHPFLSNYYDQIMEVLLVSKDDDGNKIFHDKIKFDKSFDGFKKYECEIRYKNKDFKYNHPIEKLSFLAIPSNVSITNKNETWRVKDDVVIQCQRKISNIGEIDGIRLQLSKNIFIEYSNVTTGGIFNVVGHFVRSNYRNLIKSKKQKDMDIKYLTTQCNYKVKGGKRFSIVKSGTVLQKTTIFKIKKVFKDKGNDKTLLIGLIIGILILLLSILFAIISIHYVKYMNKKRRNGNDSSSSTTTSSTSSFTSSLSGMSLTNTTAKKTQSKVSKESESNLVIILKK
uniref:6-cysteine protein n=1 Tax=Strongyloides papillosus TaxID=174720 RepID=A0A0N5B981_STREA